MSTWIDAAKRPPARTPSWGRMVVATAFAAGAAAGISPAAAEDAPSWLSLPTSSLSRLAMQRPETVPGTHHAEGVDTEHVFGFSMGSDIGQKGEIEIEMENVGGFGKRDGRYATLGTLAQVKYTLTDRIRIAPGLSFGGQQIGGVFGYDDRNHFTFNGAALEFRYKLFDRKVAPFGLTLHAQPNWSRVDEATGGRIEQYGGEFAALFDRELIADRLFAVFNIWYGTGATRERATNLWGHDSELQLHGGLSYSFVPGFLAGINVRYLRAYDGGGLDRFVGDAVYVGPTFSYNVSPAFGISGTWQFQVAGGALGDQRPLNLDQFERQQAMLRLNWHF